MADLDGSELAALITAVAMLIGAVWPPGRRRRRPRGKAAPGRQRVEAMPNLERFASGPGDRPPTGIT